MSIAEVVFSIAESVFRNTIAFGTINSMLDPDAHSRKMYGVEVSDRFLVHCQSAMKEYWTYHPFWDRITLVELLSGPPDVYPAWHDFGLPHLTDALVMERDERHLTSLLERYDRL